MQWVHSNSCTSTSDGLRRGDDAGGTFSIIEARFAGLTAVLVPLGLLAAGAEPVEFNARGVWFATAAGALGAALVLRFKHS